MTLPMQIETDGQRICIKNSPPDIARRLTYPACELAPAKFGVRAAFQRRALLQEGPGKVGFGQALVGARGLEAVIARLAERQGLPCVRRIEPPAELADPDLAAVVRFGGADIGMLQAIRKHDSIQIRYRVGVDPAKLVVQVALAYPAAVVTIAVQHKKTARHIARLLRAAEISASAITNQDYPSEGARIVVASFGQLGRAAARLHHLDLLIVVDGVAALGEVPRGYIAPLFSPDHYRVPRVVAFVLADRHPALADRVGLVALFGPETLTIPAHGWIDRPAEVVAVPFSGGKACWDPQAVTRKRRNVWHHRLRNRLVAQVARALVAGDRAALSAYIPGLDNVPAFPFPARAAVVVEGEEHAEALQARLPTWSIDARAVGQKVGEIVTFYALRNRTLEDVDVVVRGDGGTGLLPLAPSALASPSWAVARPLFVVDIWDRNHPKLREVVNSRAQAYLDDGWRPAGCDAVDFSLTLFPERDRR
jgi:hypothetical protein